MRMLKNIFSVICASFLLVGCTYFETHQGMDPSRYGPEETAVERIQLNPPDQSEYAEITESFDHHDISSVRDSSIEIYPLDGSVVAGPTMNAPGTVDIKPVPSVPVSRPVGAGTYSADPSVVIFPLDGPVPDISSALVPVNDASHVPPGNDTNFVTAYALDRRDTTVYFQHDSTALDQSGRQVVSNVVNAYAAVDGMPLSVEGHASRRSSLTDPVDRKAVNLKVSMDRAFTVAKALMENGVPADSLVVKAYGETRPAPAHNGMSAETASRRVEIEGISLQ